MIKRSLWILALTAALAACSSGVKLNEVPVEDKNASAAAPATTDAAQSNVAPVVSGKAGAQGVGTCWRECGVFRLRQFYIETRSACCFGAQCGASAI
jgi:hypothetical protein